jgi:hypothetical protein
VSEFSFGYSNGALTASRVRQMERIAKRAGCSFTYYDNAGREHPRSWFSAKDRGAPFNAQLKQEVLAAVEALQLGAPEPEARFLGDAPDGASHAANR